MKKFGCPLTVLALALVIQACAPFGLAPAATDPAATSAGTAPDPAGVQPISLRVGYGAREGDLEVYFTDPANPLSAKLKDGPDMPLVAAINAAHQSVDVAAYSMSLWSVRDALIHAQKRGVTVRIVMESDNADASVPVWLKKDGIPLVTDQRPGLMHDKFMVIDRAEVWTGSMNFTVDGAYHDNNNLLRIRSVKAAADYTTEFNEMYDDNMFGPDAVPATPYPVMTIDGSRVEIYFSPDDGVARRITKLLQDAQKSIYFLAYSFTNDDFGAAISERAGQGVTVAGVMDAEQVKSNQGTEFDGFSQTGLNVRVDGNKGLMHHKVLIIDESIVVTGSYNFSASAENTNDENVVILFNSGLAAQYVAEFWRVYGHAQK